MDSESSIENKKEENRQIKLVNKLENIKSQYIVIEIFKYMHHWKSLELIKYNKKTQNRLNISIKTYKKFSQELTPIEIEVIPAENVYCKFIHFLKDEFKQYYHIYFNKNKEEIKRNYLNKNDDITNIKIKIIIDPQVKSFEKLFKYSKNLISINFIKFYRNNITNMNEMFSGCELLNNLNLSSFNTENVIDMNNMFNNCSSLSELNLSNFNTKNVLYMNDMFIDCTSLKELDLSNFNTENVIDMNDMFLRCSSIKKINVTNFNTNKVTNMRGMFCRCSSLEELDLFNFNTNNVINMGSMFGACSSLKKLNISSSNFNVDNVSEIYFMFSNCPEEIKRKMKENIKNIKDEAFADM